MVEKRKKFWAGSISLLLVAVLGCQPPAAPLTANPDDLAATLTALIQTLTAQPSSFPATTVTGSATSTPELLAATETPFPTITPTITITASPVIPLVSVSEETNCREGPSRQYALIRKVEIGLKFEVVGKYLHSNYWIIKLPDGRQCWLWGQHAIIEGNINALPDYSGSIEGFLFIEELDGKRKKQPNATVIIQRTDITASTDNSGRYFFANAPIGELFLTSEYGGYKFEPVRVIVRIGQPSIADDLIGTLHQLELTFTPVPPGGCPTCAPTQGPVAPVSP